MWISFLVLLISVFAFALPGEQSFTPDSIQFRVESIILSTTISGGIPTGETLTLYECTSGDCLIPLSTNLSLENYKALKQIKAASYRYVTVTSCSGNETNFKSKLSGTVTIGDKRYYTHATEGLLEQQASESAQDVEVLFTQCRFYNELQTNFETSDSIELPLTLFLDLTNIAWGRNGVQTIESGCFQGEKGSDDTVFSVCMGVPHMIPVASASSPIIQKYNIHKKTEAANTASGQLVFFLDDKNNILGGFSRRIFSENSIVLDIPQFDMAIKRVSMNANGSYTISTFGTTFDNTFLNFSQFTLNDHDNKTYTNSAGESFNYAAVKQ